MHKSLTLLFQIGGPLSTTGGGAYNWTYFNSSCIILSTREDSRAVLNNRALIVFLRLNLLEEDWLQQSMRQLETTTGRRSIRPLEEPLEDITPNIVMFGIRYHAVYWRKKSPLGRYFVFLCCVFFYHYIWGRAPPELSCMIDKSYNNLAKPNVRQFIIHRPMLDIHKAIPQ